MLSFFLKSKLHSLTVTQSELNYQGSLTLGKNLMEMGKMNEFEKVLVVNVNNGARFETYLILSEKDNVVCANGAAARLTQVGDPIIVMSYTLLDEKECKKHKPDIVVFQSGKNIPEGLQ